MTEARKLIEFLQNTVPSGTPVTISSEINILESLGVVSDERAVSAMRTASLFIAPDSPATFRGLMSLLTQLIRMNPKFADKYKGTLDKALAEAAQIDDFTLDFGTFLPICQRLLDSKKERRAGSSPVK